MVGDGTWAIGGHGFHVIQLLFGVLTVHDDFAVIRRV